MDIPVVWVIVIMLGGVVILLGSGMWVGVALGAMGIIGVVFLLGLPQLIAPILTGTLLSYTLAAIPLFVFMGELLLLSGFSAQMYSGISKALNVLPGGLVQTNIASSAMFAAVVGTSTATAATISTVAYPEQKARRYNDRLVVGSLTAGGTLGPMIPPSITMILYGAYCHVSVGRLFVGTAIPGIIMALLFMCYIGVRFLLNPSLGPKREAISRQYFREAISGLRDVWPVAFIMVIIFGGIYGGIMTPTESAAVAGVATIGLIAAFRRLSFTLLRDAAFKTLEITAMCFLILVGANILGSTLAMLKVPAQVIALVAGSGLDPLMVWGFLILMYLVLGCLMCVLSMMFLTLAVVFPLMMSLGFDPIWFGVVLGMTLEAGLLTPPVGMNLFVIQGVSKVPFMEVVKGTFPFFLLLLGNIALVTFLPWLATWLPSTM